MRSLSGMIIFILIMLLLDAYVYTAIRSISSGYADKTRYWINIGYFSICIIGILALIYLVSTHPGTSSKTLRMYVFACILGLLFSKIIVSTFLLIDDVRRFIQWILQWIFPKTAHEINDLNETEKISRSVFMSWLGLAAGTTLFSSLLYGFGNKYKYQLVRKKLHFPKLPNAFKGLKIIHISDIHSGSFTDKQAVQKGIELILKQKPDLILFTGDLVNDRATEMQEYMDVFSQLKAPMGVYATLGNHDYGDYVQWPVDGVSKEQNLNNLKQVISNLGWRLLMNEHVVLEKENQQIALLGIENWSAKARFPKYGRLDLAYAGTEKYPFKILMSHDPSHWHAQVLPEYADIDLTLSGHTHGMQFGVEIPGFRWSPVQYVYKEWAGLYEDGNAKLYVNRGFGFIGYPGRVGVLPEITLLELS